MILVFVVQTESLFVNLHFGVMQGQVVKEAPKKRVKIKAKTKTKTTATTATIVEKKVILVAINI